ncbi:acyl-CoA dehydrogenase domain-containing protein [Ectopseudomonas mendocina]|jgi:alkylation response protein AidB-like acyl-CoA dehydrogenase|uniref:Cyclohexane-1-carbonyl-CoA dehydrogenase n=1 Tax=Ectopseudomonas mendocina TaxID=300 RepID=A0ABD7S473_ECTME|nr:acyl-CoA dehydrogenase family protein [Pseudomonas mendocina]QTN44682.1 acyl-CoA dehydrogenase family protein [Pseudomonas mendocina]TRO17055.1 acyl-CoA dehydrogenase [Pseudomonas mendocina]TRO21443.1 acyl-CoA dehydrogenase [Pseudomonas mendocina]SUD32109.1 acyl-CoA dehydrogenase domain-containing protein [Pseudomonas mendocina]
MDFELSDEQRLFTDSARAFAARELTPHAADWDREHHFPIEVIRRAAEQGYLALYLREEDGGLGLSRLSSSLIFEQLAAGCVATTAYLTIHNMATWMLASFADQALKDAWLPGLINGQSLASYCLTEPDAGSDAANLRTRARRDGGDYVIDGSKCFISGAGSTDVLIVMARTGEDGAKGISCLLVPADAPGVRYGRNEDKMGWKAQPTRTITFEGVRVPASNRIGPEGEGFVYAMRGLDGGRLNIASCSLGAAQAALEQSLRYVEERKQFGKALSQFQALQFKLADMLTDLTASRQMVRLAAHKLDHGHGEASLYCAMAKRFATDHCFDVCNQALQLHGGYGYLNDYPLERWVRDARVHQILEGTNEIMRVIIARRLLLQGGMLDRLL